MKKYLICNKKLSILNKYLIFYQISSLHHLITWFYTFTTILLIIYSALDDVCHQSSFLESYQINLKIILLSFTKHSYFHIIFN